LEYEDTVTYDVVTLESYKEGPKLVALVQTDHSQGHLNEVMLPMGNDGLININHLILPTADWYLREKCNPKNKFSKYTDIYFADKGRIYVIENGEPVEVNPMIFTTRETFEGTTVIKSQ